jgi:hypothetical protein
LPSPPTGESAQVSGSRTGRPGHGLRNPAPPVTTNGLSGVPVMLDGTRREDLSAGLGLPVRALDLEGFGRLLAD